MNTALLALQHFPLKKLRNMQAAVNDPARMSTSYAGVVAMTMATTKFLYRGNSPNGLLWRMEVEIQTQTISVTAELPAAGFQFSVLIADQFWFHDRSLSCWIWNALSGVWFEAEKRNNQKSERTIQAGFLGTDLAAEGPFKGYDGSYLVNYRYSTLSILSKLGVNVELLWLIFRIWATTFVANPKIRNLWSYLVSEDWVLSTTMLQRFSQMEKIHLTDIIGILLQIQVQQDWPILFNWLPKVICVLLLLLQEQGKLIEKRKTGP